MKLDLVSIAWTWGALHGLAAFALGWKPESTRKLLLAFPRSAMAGRVLTGIDLFWVAWIVFHASLGRFDALKPALYILTPVSYVLITIFMDELLSGRALGGLLLLLADPILDAIRWHDSPLRLLVTTLTYVMIVVGMTLVLSPYYFRRWVLAFAGSDGRGRWTGCACAVLAAALIVVGLSVH